ncbi:MAG: chemotaxis protein CheW [Anaerolineae bacterium]
MAEGTFDLGNFLAEVQARLITSDATPQQASAPPIEQERVMIFRLAGVHYAVSLENTAEVLRRPVITPVPGVLPWIAGVINLHGDIVSVVDLNLFFGGAPGYFSGGADVTLLVMQAADQRIAMVVDGIEIIYSYPTEEILSPLFKVQPTMVAYLRGVVQWGDRVIRLLDCERLLTGPQMLQFS